MYGVMREHARNRPMQVAGLAVSALVTAAAGYLMMNSFGNLVGAFVPPESTTLSTIVPEKTPEPPPEDYYLPDQVKFPTTAPLPLREENFQAPAPEKTITVAAGEISRAGTPDVTAAPTTIRIAPKLRSLEKPPYPIGEQRARNEGNTTLGLCIDARGRVTSASLTKSSGHPRLDEAALKWIKDARFSPGTVDGVPQAVCGHTMLYEWRLEDVR